MMGRLIDVDRLIDVLLHERDVLYASEDNETKKGAMFEAVSQCIGVVNHFPEYAAKDDLPTLTVSDVIYRYLKHHSSTGAVVLKRTDNGKEYRKIKSSTDNKNFWEVTGMYPRIKADGDNRASVEMVLWCRDRGSDTKDLYNKVYADYVTEVYGGTEDNT